MIDYIVAVVTAMAVTVGTLAFFDYLKRRKNGPSR